MTSDFTLPSKASVLFDGQFGSTGKGLVAAYLALSNDFDIATTNASANAGHTTIIGDRKFVCFHLPTSGVINEDATIYINAGAMIDPKLLLEECEEIGVNHKRVVINPRAAVILKEHKEREGGTESSTTKLASTQKGCGAALSDKISRKPGVIASENDDLKKYFTIDKIDLNSKMERGSSVFVEVPQGFSLGLNSGLAYPYCTSRDVTVSQGLSDAGIHPSFLGKVIMTARCHPIRVGNIVDQDGNTIGWSGPGYQDQVELDWSEDFPGVEPERTTVTKRIRRIFSWSNTQYHEALSCNRPDFVFLNFINYLKSVDEFRDLVRTMSSLGKPPTHYGIGPSISDVFETWQAVESEMVRRGLWK